MYNLFGTYKIDQVSDFVYFFDVQLCFLYVQKIQAVSQCEDTKISSYMALRN